MRERIVEVVEPYISGLRKRTSLRCTASREKEDAMNMRVRQLWAPVRPSCSTCARFSYEGP